MIRAIVAMDNSRGIANEQGIPWNLPSDRAYVREKTWGGTLLMGYGTYREFTKPLQGRKSLVVTSKTENLKEGFEALHDLRSYMDNPPEQLWVFGGSNLFQQTINEIDELYITQLQGDFGCTKFFPEYTHKFELATRSDSQFENGITFHYEIWKRKH